MRWRASTSLGILIIVVAGLVASAAAMLVVHKIITNARIGAMVAHVATTIANGGSTRVSMPIVLSEVPVYLGDNCTVFIGEASPCDGCVKASAILVNMRHIPGNITLIGGRVLRLGDSAIVLPSMCRGRYVTYRVEGGTCVTNSIRVETYVLNGSFVIGGTPVSELIVRIVKCGE